MYPETETQLNDFLNFTNMPGRTFPVDLSRLQHLLLSEAYAIEKAHMAASDVQTANYRAALDFMQEASVMESEEHIIQSFFDFCSMIFRPRGMLYLAVNGGEGTNELYYWGDTEADEREALYRLDKPYRLETEKASFTAALLYRDKKVGIISVRNTAFPEHLREYLNFTLAVSGSLAMAVNTARDRTRLFRLNKELEKAVEKGALANQAKNRFIATISHELRTPIHGIIGMISHLGSENLSDDQKESILHIKKSSLILKELINDVIDISKIEAGKMETVSAVFQLPDLLTETYSVFLPAAEEAGLSLTLEETSVLPPQVTGDARRIRQILFNLISNAIKFTEEGRVRISAGGRQAAEQFTLSVSVEDTGIGIPEDKQHLLFQTFSQVDSSEKRRAAGSGLGLAITKELAELLGGGLRFTSEAGAGSCFTVTLPLQIPAGHPAGPAEGKESVGTAVSQGPAVLPFPPGYAVLLAEDNKINQLTVAKTLKKEGVDLTIVPNGRKAVEACREQRFTCILMDCYMPEMDGFSAAEQIRSLGGWAREVPIIAITATSLQEDLDKCKSSGMNDYLAKPFEPKELIAKLKQWLLTGRTEFKSPDRFNRS